MFQSDFFIDEEFPVKDMKRGFRRKRTYARKTSNAQAAGRYSGYRSSWLRDLETADKLAEYEITR